jgi:hypothetical protein
MPSLMHTNKLTVVLRAPIQESTGIERIRRYFYQANYKELYDEMPAMKFKRFRKMDKVGITLIKSFFLGGFENVDPNNRYSLVRLHVEPWVDGISVKITFEEISQPMESYFTLEILQREIESFKKALFENVFEPVKMENARRLYLLSEIKQLLLLILNLALFIVLFAFLFSLLKVDTIFSLIVAGAVVVGLYFLYDWWRKKKIERRIGSLTN